MTLCEDCLQAERDPLHAVFRDALCCRARAIVQTPRRLRRAAVQGYTTDLSAQDIAALKTRCEGLLAAGKSCKAGAA